MKQLTERQRDVNQDLVSLISKNRDDKETHDALQSAWNAYLNFIQTGERIPLKTTPTGL